MEEGTKRMMFVQADCVTWNAFDHTPNANVRFRIVQNDSPEFNKTFSHYVVLWQCALHIIKPGA